MDRDAELPIVRRAYAKQVLAAAGEPAREAATIRGDEIAAYLDDPFTLPRASLLFDFLDRLVRYRRDL